MVLRQDPPFSLSIVALGSNPGDRRDAYATIGLGDVGGAEAERKVA
jgi:hypothetical protein